MGTFRSRPWIAGAALAVAAGLAGCASYSPRSRHGIGRRHGRDRTRQGRCGAANAGSRGGRTRQGRAAAGAAPRRRRLCADRAFEQSRPPGRLQRARASRGRHGDGEPAAQSGLFGRTHCRFGGDRDRKARHRRRALARHPAGARRDRRRALSPGAAARRRGDTAARRRDTPGVLPRRGAAPDRSPAGRGQERRRDGDAFRRPPRRERRHEQSSIRHASRSFTPRSPPSLPAPGRRGRASASV